MNCKHLAPVTQANPTCRAIKSAYEFTPAVTRCDVLTLKDTGTERGSEISFINNQREVAIHQSDILSATFAAPLTSHHVYGEGKGRTSGQRATINCEGQTRRSEVNQDQNHVK